MEAGSACGFFYLFFVLYLRQPVDRLQFTKAAALTVVAYSAIRYFVEWFVVSAASVLFQ